MSATAKFALYEDATQTWGLVEAEALILLATLPDACVDAIVQPSSNQNRRIRPLCLARARKHITHAISAASGVATSSTQSVTRAPPIPSPIQAPTRPVTSTTTPAAARKRRRVSACSINQASTEDRGVLTARGVCGQLVLYAI